MCINKSPEHEALQAKYDQLMEKLRRMRGYQAAERRYHGMVPSEDKARCRKLEKDVDAMILEDMKQRKGSQGNVFG
jgi:hypothetical protein